MLLRDGQGIGREGDGIGSRRRCADRRQVCRRDGRRRASGTAARRRTHHLRRRQRLAVFQIVIHRVHCPIEVDMQRDEARVIAGQRGVADEGIKVLRVGHFDVAEFAVRVVDLALRNVGT